VVNFGDGMRIELTAQEGQVIRVGKSLKLSAADFGFEYDDDSTEEDSDAEEG